jgi:hypothetical protein
MAFVDSLLLVAAAALPLAAQNCAGSTTGNVPLTELGGLYQGYAGGLYPGVANQPPAAHQNAGLVHAATVTPLLPGGQPGVGGRVAAIDGMKIPPGTVASRPSAECKRRADTGMYINT